MPISGWGLSSVVECLHSQYKALGGGGSGGVQNNQCLSHSVVEKIKQVNLAHSGVLIKLSLYFKSSRQAWTAT